MGTLAIALPSHLGQVWPEAVWLDVLLGYPFSIYALGRLFFKPIANLVQMRFCMKLA